MSIEFIPPIDLTFGFTLNAVGGVIGIEHRLDTDALRASLADGALDHIMFPADPVAAAPGDPRPRSRRCSRWTQGSIVIGPMIEVGWGRPVSFLTAQVGVILSPARPEDRHHRSGPHRAAGAASCRSSTCARRCTARSRPTTC